MAPKENSLKKNYRSEFLQSSFIFVIYLSKEVYRKIMSEISFRLSWPLLGARNGTDFYKS